MSSAAQSGLKRLALLMSGEGLQSGLHFALNLAFMHQMSAHDYGVFAIAMVIGGIGLSYVRSITGIPASVFIGRARTQRQRRFFEDAFALFAVALASTIAFIGYGTLLFIEPAVALSAAAFVALWSTRAHARTVYFASERQREATYGDIAFFVSGFLLAALILWHGANLLQHALLLLAAGNLIGLAVMRFSSGVPLLVMPRKVFAPVYARIAPQLGWSIFGVTTLSVQAQGISFLIVALAGPAAFAPLAAMIVFFAPMRIVATALVNYMQPKISHCLAGHDMAGLQRRFGIWTVSLVVFSLLYAVGMAIALPFVASKTLFDGPTLLIAVCAWAISAMPFIYISPRLLLEVLLRFRAVTIITIIAAIVGFGLTGLLLVQAPLHWVLLGSVASEVTVAVASWIVGLRALREVAKRQQ